MKKINLVEILKDCPKGMELDCTMLDNVVFEKIDFSSSHHPIIIRRTDSNKTIHLTKYGQYSTEEDYKCVIFPKGKTTWEGFQRPFVDGDVICYLDSIAIFKEWGDATLFRTYVTAYLHGDSTIDVAIPLFGKSIRREARLATEEEKAKLFQAIKNNGYKWNPETKTLEKLIQPKFKVGDRVKLKNSEFIYTITDLLKDRYRATIDSRDLYEIEFKRQDAYILAPNKFDINTLVPFESRVLIRDYEGYMWVPVFWGGILDRKQNRYLTTRGAHEYCIPYEGNEHLLGKTDDCSEYFKTWKD